MEFIDGPDIEERIEDNSSKDIYDGIYTKLEEFNKSIDFLIQQRTIFMDKVMDDICEFNVGDKCINILTGEKVTVLSVYRAKAGKYKDNSFNNVFMKLSNGDDTYRYHGNHPYCKKDDFEEKKATYIERLENFVKWRHNVDERKRDCGYGDNGEK